MNEHDEYDEIETEAILNDPDTMTAINEGVPIVKGRYVFGRGFMLEDDIEYFDKRNAAIIVKRSNDRYNNRLRQRAREDWMASSMMSECDSYMGSNFR
jgi:hypothetical protein